MKVFNVFSASMKGAVIDSKIEASPCVGITLDRPSADDEYFMERGEVERLVKCSRGNLLPMIVKFGVGTGLRWGEIAGMHRARISIQHQRITVQEVYDKDNGEIKPYPKGKKRRGVPITAELAADLDKWMQDHPAIPCRAKHRDGTKCRGALLFPSRAGTPLNYGNMRRRLWDQAVVAAGLDGATPHDMRHTYASWLIQDGAGIETVSALLGHASIETTQRYAHLADTQWGRVREILHPSKAPVELSAEAIRAAVQQLAETHPGQWAAVAEALDSPESAKVAPLVPHAEPSSSDGKIIAVDFRRRSTGS